MSGVIRWEDPPAWQTLPIFNELRAQPFRWAVIWEERPGPREEQVKQLWKLQDACYHHPRIKVDLEQRHQVRPDGGDSYYAKTLRACYVPFGEPWDSAIYRRESDV